MKRFAERSSLLTATLFCMLTCATVWAQSTAQINGIVKDQSGAVLPGVTVEASSPVLIEKSRSTITDERGTYKMIDLRPGTYSMEFSLPGFAPVKRDVELPSNFTATINAEMKVGGLAESITVAAEAPVVDSQTNFKAWASAPARLWRCGDIKLSFQSIAWPPKKCIRNNMRRTIWARPQTAWQCA